jgi:hypothetical protein
MAVACYSTYNEAESLTFILLDLLTTLKFRSVFLQNSWFSCAGA